MVMRLAIFHNLNAGVFLGMRLAYISWCESGIDNLFTNSIIVHKSLLAHDDIYGSRTKPRIYESGAK
jgi:hypothetical protein